jgi:hypothetical protein
VAQKIQEITPGCLVLVNEVPKAWVDYEIYCQLIPNNDPNSKTYKVLPRIGAFEVSFKGVVKYFMTNKNCVTLAAFLEIALRHVASL